MAITKIADIIIPEIFQPYIVVKTLELSVLVQSGIVVPDTQLDELARTGGTLINMPFFNDLDGEDEVLQEGPLTPGKITTSKDVAALLMRGKAWGATDLAKAVSGADPMAAIGQLVATYWNRREQATLIAALNGVFAAASMAYAVHNVAIEDGVNAAEANLIGGAVVIDAATKLGDAAGQLTALAMHSVPFSRLQKLNLIVYVNSTTGERLEAGANLTSDAVPTYLGKRVLVDDNCPVVDGGTSGKKYTTYLFGQGAIGRGEGQAPVPVETDRDSLAGEDYLIHRRHFILHPRGVKWVGTPAGLSPTNTELSTGTNWLRVYPEKNIRLVKLVTNG